MHSLHILHKEFPFYTYYTKSFIYRIYLFIHYLKNENKRQQQKAKL